VENILLYFGALMCSHLAAFGTLYEIKINFASYLSKVPLDFKVLVGSGNLLKIMDENIEKIEGFIAHQLPDIVAAFVAPVVMALRWTRRFGLTEIVGIVVAYAIQMKANGNEGTKEKVSQYQTALEYMNNTSVEYIRASRW